MHRIFGFLELLNTKTLLNIQLTTQRSKKETELYPGPDQDLVNEWKFLQYKPFYKEIAQYSSFSGFYSDCTGLNLFIALMEHIGEKYP